MSKELVVQKKNLIEQAMPEMAKVLPSALNPTRVLRVYQNAVTKNPRLAECTNVSLLNSFMCCSEFGLEPNTVAGHCYIIPYNNRKIGQYEAQFQIGYKGLALLASRCGALSNNSTHVVREKDKFTIILGDKPAVIHEPFIGDDAGEVIYYYSALTLTTGGVSVEGMTPKQAEAHAIQYSKTWGKPDSPWTTNFNSMAKKTVLIQALKAVPVEFDSMLTKALASDVDYIDVQAEPVKRVASLDDITEHFAEQMADEPEPEADEPREDLLS